MRSLKGLDNGFIGKYYENGNLAEYGEYSHSIKNGSFVWFYENENVSRIETYKKEMPEVEENSRYYINGISHGKFLRYYENGNISSCEEYTDGKKNGYSLQFYENKKLKNIINYKNGQGNFVSYYENGNVKSKGKSKVIANHYVDLIEYEDQKIGEWIWYHENGNIKKDGSYERFGKAKKDRVFRKVKKDEKKGDTYYYIVTLKDGKWTSYFEDGTIEEVETYENGRLKK